MTVYGRLLVVPVRLLVVCSRYCWQFVVVCWWVVVVCGRLLVVFDRLYSFVVVCGHNYVFGSGIPITYSSVTIKIY